MRASVSSNELTLTEAHVGLICERHHSPGHGICSGPAAMNVGESDKPVEIGDLRWIIDVRQWGCRVQWIVMDKNPKGLKGGNAAGIGFGLTQAPCSLSASSSA